jgi:hypothetical protein
MSLGNHSPLDSILLLVGSTYLPLALLHKRDVIDSLLAEADTERKERERDVQISYPWLYKSTVANGLTPWVSILLFARDPLSLMKRGGEVV